MRTRWRILYAVNHGRAVADARHAWIAADLAARNRRQARLIGVVMALWGLLQTVITVVHVVRHDWLLTAGGVAQLLLLGVGSLLLPWSPSRVARAEMLNPELAEDGVLARLPGGDPKQSDKTPLPGRPIRGSRAH